MLMSLTLLATGEGGADLVGLANGGLFIFVERFWFLVNRFTKQHKKICNQGMVLRLGRILPMAWKFCISSNSEEFGTLALLDFSPFVITKP